MKYANGVKATTLTTGTGDVTLAEVSGYVPFPLAFSVGDTIPYAIHNGQNWEWGVGTVQAGGVLERTTVASTLVAGVFTDVAPARITLTGVSEVVCAITAEDYRALNDSLLAHTADVANPHGVTAAQANADPAGTAAGLVAAHEAALDPHGVYPLEADLGTAAFLDAGTAVGDLVQVQAGGALPALDASALLNLPASGVTDHGALTGLADDDHGHYHTNARGDARYAPIAKGVTNGDSHNHDGGDGAQIAYASLSGLPTLGTAAAENTTAFEASGAVSTHAALTTAHGISAFGATLVDDADAATARTTLGLGTAATTASTAYATSTQGSSADAHIAASAPHSGHSTPASVATLISTHNSDGAAHPSLVPTTTTIGTLINGATSKTTPVDADKVSIWDSVSGLLQAVTWANIKIALFGVNSTLARLVVKGADTSNSTLGALVQNSSGDAMFSVANGAQVIFGRTTTAVPTTVSISPYTPNVQILAPGAQASFLIGRFSNNTFAPRMGFLKSSGASIGAVNDLVAGSVLGEISFAGTNGTQAAEGARISVQTTAINTGQTFSPAAMLFYTSNGNSILNPCAVLTENGDLVVGGSVASARAHIIKTTEQLRLGYDATNYQSVTVSSGGIPTWTSTGGAFIFQGDIRLNKTVTTGGTTGAQTINKSIGSVNFAAGASSLVVTNSLVTTSSVITAIVGTNDATMKSVAAVAAAGSFTLHANAAATAETRVNFNVFN